jgi:chorismate synthase
MGTGHADLAGSRKYGFEDMRNVLERSSARETTTRVAIGADDVDPLTADDPNLVAVLVRTTRASQLRYFPIN